MSSKKQKFNILFLCSGNSCRSPMAEGLLKLKIPEELEEHVEIKSAGTLGIEGSRATPNAIEAARDLGADISDHFSQGVTENLLKEADLIFAMADNHIEFVNRHFPEFRENLHLLRRFDRERTDEEAGSISDPVGGGRMVYQACANLLNTELERVLPRLEKLIRVRLDPKD